MAIDRNSKQYKALVAEIKKNPGESERHYADKSGIPQGQIGSVLYHAELEADPKLKIPATSKGIVAARNKGLRWPRIAAYSGLSVAEVKRLFEEETGTAPSESWTGRGRRFDGGTSTSTGTSGRKAAGRKTGVKVVAKKGTSGRRGAAAKKATAAPAGRRGAAGRRGTRASADPK